MGHDIRDALRAFRKAPAFSVLAVLVLALGIGVNTAIFSLVHAVLFKPPQVRAPSELRYIYGQPDTIALGYRQYQQILTAQDVIPDLVAVSSTTARLGPAVDGRNIAGEAVSANYFDVLGVTPILGRRFIPAEDEAPNPEQVTIISHRLWLRQFSGDPGVIGRKVELTRPYVRLEDQWPTYAIIGVAPEGFTGVSSPWSAADFWVPMVQRAADQVFDRGDSTRRTGTRYDAYFRVLIGRLPPGQTDARATAAFAAVGEQIRLERFPRTTPWTLVPFDGRRVRLPFDPRGQIVPERLAAGLFLVAGVVLVIAVTNLAGMLMARGVSRQQETAVRLSLGASRWQIARRMLVESLILALAGGLGGIAMARIGVVALLSQTPTSSAGQFQSIPFTLDVAIDATVLTFTLLIGLGAAVVIAMAPARQAARVDLLSVLGAGVAASPRRARWRMRHLIVIPQVGLSAALLLVAGVLARPLLKAELVDPGYTQDKLAFAEFSFPSPPRDTYKDKAAVAAWRESRARFQTRLLESLDRAPEVSAGALAFGLPFSMSSTAAVIAREAFPDGRHWWVKQNHVSPRYFEALGMKFLDGRTFEARDRADTPRVAVISATLAQWMWPGRSAVGEYLALHRPDDVRPPQWVEVIGVVSDVQPPITTGSSNPFIYVPVDDVHAMTIVARSHAEVRDLTRVLRKIVADADASVEISRSGPVGEAIAAIEYPRRMAAGILSASGLIGLVLAAAGLYGVISYSVAQRLRELGIRATLGAGQRALMVLVLREGVTVACIGAALGLVVALIAVRLTSSFVVAIPNIDATTLIVVPLVLLGVVLAACYVPARRASRVDPIVVLRAG